MPMLAYPEPMLARVPVLVVKPSDELDVIGFRVLRMGMDPVFRGHVGVAQNMAGFARNRIAHAGDAIGERRLIGQESGRMSVADAG